MDDFVDHVLRLTYHDLRREGVDGSLQDWIALRDRLRANRMNFLAAAVALERQSVRNEGYMWLMDVEGEAKDAEAEKSEEETDALRHLPCDVADSIRTMAQTDGIDPLDWLSWYVLIVRGLYLRGVQLKAITPAWRELARLGDLCGPPGPPGAPE